MNADGDFSVNRGVFCGDERHCICGDWDDLERFVEQRVPPREVTKQSQIETTRQMSRLRIPIQPS